jgi:GntR family transcriptional regulator / MocR family aminotransferase
MKRTTSAAELLVRLERRRGMPLRVQLERELRSAIQCGRLPPGSLLPSSRALAADLGLSRGVVVEAYEQLFAEGYLSARHGSSTRVATRRRQASLLPAPSPQPASPRFDFRPGLPDFSLFPRRRWMMSMRRALAAVPDLAFDYPDPRGIESARVALATYLNRARGTAVHSNNVLFCSGSAQGIGLICRVLKKRRVRALAVEDPGHADQCTDIQSAGLETPRIPVDAEGIKVERLARSGAGAVLVTPAHQYPAGVVLAPKRRAELLDWAERTRSLVIEDDYDAEYRYDREPIGALQGLAPERVIYVGSASKVLSPALRLGWLAAPSDLATDIAQAKLQADRGSSVFEQLALADFLDHGELDRHLRRTRPVYRQRRDTLVRALKVHLPDTVVHGVAAGLHLLIELDAAVDEESVVASAARRSVRVYGARPYRAHARVGPPALIVGYGGISSALIDEGVRELARVIEECRNGRSAAVRSR